MANTENILKVADAIERHSIEGLGFNMRFWNGECEEHPDMSGHNCNTVACMGGWTEAVLNTAGTQWLPAHTLLGLEPGQSVGLFFPDDCADDTITPAQAVAVLRHLAATGDVDWSVAAPTETAGA